MFSMDFPGASRIGRFFPILYSALFLAVIGWNLDRMQHPMVEEGWLSDVAYNLNLEFNGGMARDIPWGSGWVLGIGKLFFILHHGFYVLFGAGLYQARMVSFLAGLGLLTMVFLWTRTYVSRQSAVFAVFLLSVSSAFFYSLPYCRQFVFDALFSFSCFYLLSSAVFSGRNQPFLWMGMLSSLSVDFSFRGIELVLICIFATIFCSPPGCRFRRIAFFLLGCVPPFMSWYALNVLPMGFGHFVGKVLPIAILDGDPYGIESLLSEFHRFKALFSLSSGKIDFSIWIVLLPAFFRLSRRPYPKPLRLGLIWLLLTFVVRTIIEKHHYPHHVLIYSHLLSVFCACGLESIMSRSARMAASLVAAYMLLASGGLFLILYSNRSLDAERYFNEARARVDASKAILGPQDLWYAFRDSDYYGGQSYINVCILMKMLPAPGESPSPEAGAQAFLDFLGQRSIVYVILDARSPGSMGGYFPERNLPASNFELISSLPSPYFRGRDDQMWKFYRITSYRYGG